MMEDKIINILKTVFELEEIDSTISQENCDNWDSISHLSLVVELEAEFDISLEPEEIADMKDLKSINHIINAKLNR